MQYFSDPPSYGTPQQHENPGQRSQAAVLSQHGHSVTIVKDLWSSSNVDLLIDPTYNIAAQWMFALPKYSIPACDIPLSRIPSSPEWPRCVVRNLDPLNLQICLIIKRHVSSPTASITPHVEYQPRRISRNLKRILGYHLIIHIPGSRIEQPVHSVDMPLCPILLPGQSFVLRSFRNRLVVLVRGLIGE